MRNVKYHTFSVLLSTTSTSEKKGPFRKKNTYCNCTYLFYTVCLTFLLTWMIIINWEISITETFKKKLKVIIDFGNPLWKNK